MTKNNNKKQHRNDLTTTMTTRTNHDNGVDDDDDNINSATVDGNVQATVIGLFLLFFSLVLLLFVVVGRC